MLFVELTYLISKGYFIALRELDRSKVKLNENQLCMSPKISW